MKKSICWIVYENKISEEKENFNKEKDTKGHRLKFNEI